jgi:hypothetical protein
MLIEYNYLQYYYNKFISSTSASIVAVYNLLLTLHTMKYIIKIHIYSYYYYYDYYSVMTSILLSTC